MTADEQFMKRALQLASLGLGHVAPNPMVGCVVVHDQHIIGEGWHRAHGQAHAEVNALDAVREKALIPGSTVYVTLEPCTHFGKTPPCSDRLIREKVGKVVICNIDTNAGVSGGGATRLENAGVEVVSGVLFSEGRHLNRRFFSLVEKERPWIILKWAETADGFMARENLDSKWISNERSRDLVHTWRAQEDAVMVGTGTAQHDNPRLNVRNGAGRNPLRVVSDRFLRLHDNLHLFDGSQPTRCYNVLKHEKQDATELIRLGESNYWNELFADLGKCGITSVLVEGGSTLLHSLVAAGLWDEMRRFRSPRAFGKGLNAPAASGHLAEERTLDEDVLQIFYKEPVGWN